MKKKKASPIISSILMVILIGFSCNFIWLYEILHIKGWYGLNWLDGYMNSVFLIIPLTVCSFIIALRFLEKISIKNLLISLFGLSVVSLISFDIAREFLYLINIRLFGFTSSLYIYFVVALGFIVPNTIFCIGYYYVTNRFLIKISKRTIFLFLGSIVFSIVFGLITVNINSGFGSGNSFIDSVKMGYPVFWLNISFGIIAIIIKMNNKISVNHN